MGTDGLASNDFLLSSSLQLSDYKPLLFLVKRIFLDGPRGCLNTSSRADSFLSTFFLQNLFTL